MIEDNSLRLSDAQAITATAPSTHVIDLGQRGGSIARDIGVGSAVPLSVRVVQSFNNLTSLTVAVQTSPDNASWTTIATGRAVPLAELMAGHQFAVPASFPEGTRARYVRLHYTIAGTAPTSGAVSAVVVADRQTAG